jgi:AcrR family transcriptional regulator
LHLTPAALVRRLILLTIVALAPSCQFEALMTETFDRERSPPARVQRRRTQAALIERTALALFAEHGFDSVTIEQIAEASAISRRTFFRYFASKEEVLLGDDRRYEDALAGTLEDVTQKPVLSALRRSLIALAVDSSQDNEATQSRLMLFSQSPQTMAAASERGRTYRQRLTPLLATRLGLEETDIRAMLIVDATLSATSLAIWHWLFEGATGDLASTVAEALDYTLAGYMHLDV